MAVVNTFNRVPNDEEQQNATQFVNRPVNVSGLSAAPAPTAAPVSAAAPTIGQGTSNNSNPTSSGRFTNLQNYLNANKDYNKSGGGLAGQMNTNFKNQATGIEKDLTATRNQFNTSAEAGRTKADNALTAQAFADPNAFVQNTANIDAFNKQRDATYTGPTTFDTSGLTSKNSNLQSNTNLTSNEGGRFALLNKMFGKQDYNSGSQKLDNLLLQGNSQQLGALQNSRTLPSGIENNINTNVVQAEQAAQNNAREAQAVSANTRAGLSKEILGYDQNARDLSALYNKDQTSAQNTARYNLGRNSLSDAEMAAFGIPKDLRFSDNIKLTDYYSDNPLSTAQSVMTAPQYAQMAALSKLSNTGSAASSEAATALSNYGNPALADTYANRNSPYEFKGADFLKAVNNEKTQYLSGLDEINKRVTPYYTGDSKNPWTTVKALEVLKMNLDKAHGGNMDDNKVRNTHGYTFNDTGFKANPATGWDSVHGWQSSVAAQNITDLMNYIRANKISEDGLMPNGLNTNTIATAGDASIPTDMFGRIRTGVAPTP